MACLTPIRLESTDKITGEQIYIYVPCGKCEDCLKKKQSDWISRLLVETQMSLSSFFITLTYDEKHLPFPEGVNKKDVQLFFKRFRKLFNKTEKFKYFLVSEYGAISSRPHYHFLLFCRFCLSPISLSYILEDSWKLGQHKIGTVDISSITYCSKYCLKSKRDVRHIFDNKTFAMMSKRPAIGYDLFNIKKQFSDVDCFEVVSGDRCVAMPRYYRDRMGFDPEAIEAHNYELQEKYKATVQKLGSVIDPIDRVFRRLSFERKQERM